MILAVITISLTMTAVTAAQCALQGYQKQVIQKEMLTALPSDDALMPAMYYLVAIYLQFQLYPLLFVHLIIVLGFWALAL